MANADDLRPQIRTRSMGHLGTLSLMPSHQLDLADTGHHAAALSPMARTQAALRDGTVSGPERDLAPHPRASQTLGVL